MIEELTLPRALKKIHRDAFEKCEHLSAIYVEEGCKVSLCGVEIPNSAKAGPLPETTVGGARVWDLRNCKHVVIPEGTEKIGN